MKRVFVSYSSHDRPAVAGVVSQLSAAGFEVWFDQNVSGGQQWWGVILEQLRGCDVVAAMVTESSVSSSACRAELAYAEQLGKTIVPVQLGEVDPAESPSDLQQRQWIDYREPTIQHTLSLVKAVNQAPSVSLPDPLPTPPPVPFSYQTQVTDRIYGDTPLTLDQQVGVVFGLRQLLQEGHDPDHVVSLATRFRARDDLLAAVVPDADEVLARARAATTTATAEVTAEVTATIPATPPPRPPDPAPPRLAPFGEPRRRTRRNVIVGAVVALVLVVAIAVATSGGDDPTDAADTTLVAEEADTTTPSDDTVDTAAETTVAADAATDVEISGVESWTDTGIDLQQGDTLTITAQGDVVHNLGNGASTGPDGDDDPGLQQFNVTDVAPHSALIGRIDDAAPFLVGSYHEMTVEQSGRLYLGPNDAGVDNNDGSFTASIFVVPTGG